MVDVLVVEPVAVDVELGFLAGFPNWDAVVAGETCDYLTAHADASRDVAQADSLVLVEIDERLAREFGFGGAVRMTMDSGFVRGFRLRSRRGIPSPAAAGSVACRAVDSTASAGIEASLNNALPQPRPPMVTTAGSAVGGSYN
ncbi:hypothetical protein [Nocardia wallacei]|uniref:hypothetical protein n=1 Tax=Nocardia wallacei TaxID=480035 RepID=UPI0024554650|nr:hypothetical protein [Nocardia wallacei]